jgi:hypothetical protein
MKLSVSITSIIAHGHGDIRYVHYGLYLYPSDLYHIVNSIAKVLRDLEDAPKCASRHIFPNSHATPLFNAHLEGSKVCKSSLPPSQQEAVVAKLFPPILNLQLDNAYSDNKNRYTLCFLSLLVPMVY